MIKNRIVVVLPDDDINHLYIWLVWCFHTNQIIYFSDGFYGFSIFQDHNNLREAINYTYLNACVCPRSCNRTLQIQDRHYQDPPLLPL